MCSFHLGASPFDQHLSLLGLSAISRSVKINQQFSCYQEKNFAVQEEKLFDTVFLQCCWFLRRLVQKSGKSKEENEIYFLLHFSSFRIYPFLSMQLHFIFELTLFPKIKQRKQSKQLKNPKGDKNCQYYSIKREKLGVF